MLYIRLAKGDEDQNPELIYYCRDSTHSIEKAVLDKKAVVVLETQVAKKEIDFSYIVNEYTTLDPTLPRLKGMKCPNLQCPTINDKIKTETNEIVFLRYDDDALKYLYICPCCREVWKSPV